MTAVFRSPYRRFTVHIGSRAVEFENGAFDTKDQQLINELRAIIKPGCGFDEQPGTDILASAKGADRTPVEEPSNGAGDAAAGNDAGATKRAAKRAK